MPVFLKLKKVIEVTTLSRSTIYRLASKGKFPSPLKISERSSVWLEEEILAYLDKHIKNR
jgi:prophage regulatory protein